MSAQSTDTWDEFAGFAPADIRRRQMHGQEGAELRVSALETFRDVEPLTVPMQRVGWVWAAIGVAVAAVVATFALSRTPHAAAATEVKAPPVRAATRYFRQR